MKTPKMALTALGSLVVLAGFALLAQPATAQPKAEIRVPAKLDLPATRKAGAELAARMLGLKPAENSTFRGVLRITANHETLAVPFTCSTWTGDSSWTNIYEVAPREPKAESVRLAILRTLEGPNEYLLTEGSSPERHLTGDESMIPFVGSDFWIADLGLEFLHWPDQRMTGTEMRRSQSCRVLESINPQANAKAYSKVVSWVDIDSGGIVHADAYDANGKLLKQFDPKGFKKIAGQWQLEEMEIRNRQTGSRTRIEFKLGG